PILHRGLPLFSFLLSPPSFSVHSLHHHSSPSYFPFRRCILPASQVQPPPPPCDLPPCTSYLVLRTFSVHTLNHHASNSYFPLRRCILPGSQVQLPSTPSYFVPCTSYLVLRTLSFLLLGSYSQFPRLPFVLPLAPVLSTW